MINIKTIDVICSNESEKEFVSAFQYDVIGEARDSTTRCSGVPNFFPSDDYVEYMMLGDITVATQKED